MIELKRLVDMVATDALEEGMISDEPLISDTCHSDIEGPDLPPIPFSLRVVRRSDGTLEWRE